MSYFPPLSALQDAANAFTAGGLLLSFAGVLAAARGHLAAALICLMWAGFIDTMDGVIARNTRRTPLQGALGARLDTIVDVCAFGFAPAVTGYLAGLDGTFSVLVLGALVLAAALRLAWFDVVGLVDTEAGPAFVGLPVTYVSLVVPAAFLSGLWLPHLLWRPVVILAYLSLTVALVGPWRVPKLAGVWYGVFTVCQMAMTALLLSHPLPRL